MTAPGAAIDDLQRNLHDRLRAFERDSRSVLKAALSQAGGSAIGAEVTDKCGEQQLLVLRSAASPRGFGSRTFPIEVTLTTAAGKTQSFAGGIEALPINFLLPLSCNSIAGEELQRAVGRYARSASEADLGQRIYLDLSKRLQDMSQAGDYLGAINVAESVNRDAQVRGELLGRLLTQSVADGYAYYLVTAEKADQVRLQHLDVMDGYSVAQWGGDAWVDRNFVTQQLGMSEKLKSSFARRSHP